MTTGFHMHDSLPAAPRARGAARVAAPSDTRAATMPVLSLFLLLLAFFILLNSLAQYELTRTRAILGSLNATFNTLDPAGSEHEFSSFVGLVAATDTVEESLDAVLRTLVGFDRFALIREGTVLAVDVDADALFFDEATPVPALPALAERIAGALNPVPGGYTVDLEVVTHAGPGPVAAAAGPKVDLAMRRAAAIVRTLQRAGVDADRLLAGIGAGDAARVRIELRLRDGENAGEAAR